MTQMYLVSDEELNTFARRRRLDVLEWVREAALATSSEDTAGYDQQLIEELLARVEQQVRQDRLGYDYQEQEISPLMEDEFAALEEDNGETEEENAIEFMLAHADEDDTMRMLDVAADDAVHVDTKEEDQPILVGEQEYPAFPSQHTEVTQYTAEDEAEPEAQVEADPEPLVITPPPVEEEGIKRNAAAQRQLNREISLIDRD